MNNHNAGKQSHNPNPYPILIYRETGVDVNHYIRHITQNHHAIKKIANPKYLKPKNIKKNTTLYIDSIDTYNKNAQGIILQIIQNIENTISIIATAQPNLIEKTKNGAFNAELFYLLTIKTHTVPPLRKRTQYIQPLITQYIMHENQKQNKIIRFIEKNTLTALTQYPWHENEKQLKQSIKRAIALCKSDSLSHHEFPQIPIKKIKGENERIPINTLTTQECQTRLTYKKQNGHIRKLGDIEADIIKIALNHYNGKLTETAKHLGIGRATLYRKINLHKINHKINI